MSEGIRNSVGRVIGLIRLKRRFVGSTLVVILTISAALYVSSREQPEATAVENYPYVAVARGRVDVEGGIIQLAARRDGIVKAVYVEEGDKVKAGDILVALDDQQARLSLDLARKEMAQAHAGLGELGVRLRAAEREQKRLQSLVDAAAAARIELDQARDQVELLRSEIKTAKRSYQSAQARVLLAEYELEQRLVRAPLNGHIVRRQARPGDGISTLNTTALFWFVPDTPRIVRADLEERFISVVKSGTPVEVVLEGDAPVSLRGRVRRMGLLFGPKRPATDDPYERSDSRVVECVVEVDETNATLVLGQRVLVRFRHVN